jgi:hypothetical protein
MQVLTSPTFHPATHPRWRDAIQQTWSYLTTYYNVQTNPNCSTTLRFHCSPNVVPPVPRATQFLRIAQAIIHFEPVLDLSLPVRAESEPTKRNWRDNPLLGQANLTQAESIALLEDTSNLRGSSAAMVSTILGHDTMWDRTRYTWSLRQVPGMDVFMFSKPIVCERGEDLIHCADMNLSFLRAAIACSSPAQLQMIAMNQHGLRYFLSGQLINTRRRLIEGVWWQVDTGSGQRVVRRT